MPPCLQIQRRPVERVSPWPIVFVAIRPKCPLAPQQVERAAEEVGHEIGVAVRLLVDRLEPVEITARVPGRERVLARERRIAHERVEPGVRAVEDLGELDLPVKGNDRMRSAAKLADGCLEPLMARHVELAALGREVLRQRLEPLLPFPIVVGREEGGDDEIAIAAPGSINPSAAVSRSRRRASDVPSGASRICRRCSSARLSCPSMAARAKSRCFSGFQWKPRI